MPVAVVPWEVQRFLDIAWAPASRNNTPLPDDRTVGVTLQEVSRPQLPQALQSLDLRAYDLRHVMPGSGVQRPVVWEEIEQQSPARDEFPALVSELAKRLKALQTIEQARVKPSGQESGDCFQFSGVGLAAPITWTARSATPFGFPRSAGARLRTHPPRASRRRRGGRA